MSAYRKLHGWAKQKVRDGMHVPKLLTDDDGHKVPRSQLATFARCFTF